MRSLFAAIAIAAVLPIYAQEQTAPAPASRVLNVQGGKIRVVTVASGLFHPFSLAFIDAQTILVAEKNGKLRIIHDGVLSPTPVWSIAASAQANDALHFIAVHPKFAQNKMVYMSYPK